MKLQMHTAYQLAVSDIIEENIVCPYLKVSYRDVKYAVVIDEVQELVKKPKMYVLYHFEPI